MDVSERCLVCLQSFGRSMMFDFCSIPSVVRKAGCAEATLRYISKDHWNIFSLIVHCNMHSFCQDINTQMP